MPAIVDAQRFKRAALIVAQRLACAEAELRRRGSSRLNDQNQRPFEIIFKMLASARKRVSPEALLEIRPSNV
jgi:hypothetical protein